MELPFTEMMKAVFDRSPDGPVTRLRVSVPIFEELLKWTHYHKEGNGALDFNGIPVILDPNIPDDAIVKEFGWNR